MAESGGLDEGRIIYKALCQHPQSTLFRLPPYIHKYMKLTNMCTIGTAVMTNFLSQYINTRDFKLPNMDPNVPSAVPSEDIVGEKMDRCITNMVLRSGMAFGVGAVGSLVLFRRRLWPVWLATGFGFGQSYAECSRLFQPQMVYGSTGSRRTEPAIIAAVPTSELKGAIAPVNQKLV